MARSRLPWPCPESTGASDIDHGFSDSEQGYDDDDEYKDDYDDAWDDETTWGKFSTTTTTETSDAKLTTTPPHIFCFGSLAPPKAIHVDDPPPNPNDHSDPTADECADSTADDCAVFAENRADFTANAVVAHAMNLWRYGDTSCVKGASEKRHPFD